jgi:hypothetical protein
MPGAKAQRRSTMRLKALDQMHVSAVKTDSLRPGEEFEISDSAGDDLLKAHPTKFRRLDAPAAVKADPPPKNKALAAPANKAAPKRTKPAS